MVFTLFNYHKQYLTLIKVIQGCHSLLKVEEVID